MSTGYILKYVLQGAPITLEIAAGAWVLGSVLGLLLALVRHPGGILGFSAASVITVLRCVPPLVLLYVVFFGLAADGVAIPAVPAAAAALGLVEASFTAEYFRAGFLTVQSGQYRRGAQPRPEPVFRLPARHRPPGLYIRGTPVA